MATRHVEDDRPIGELFAEAMRDVGHLVRQELELAKTETREELGQAARTAAAFGVAGLLGFLALMLVAFAAAWALAEVMPAGLAFLLVGLVIAGVAYAAARIGKERLEHLDPVPHETVDTIKEDVQWVKARNS
jgi:hypothetical protein